MQMRLDRLAAISLAALAAPAAFAQDVEITHGDARVSMRGPDAAYTGVGIADMLFLANEDSDLTAAQVTFEPGARTAWHNHLAGQYLVVTSGVGWVQARGGPKRVIRAGDVVWTPPGVAHWHGATTTSSMSHIAIWEFVDGSGGELFEHVSDEDYLAEPTAE
jgi:quercetin dioxygenase-like cupin family protein